jgi:polyhydroxyalkanoate synthesis repressor PhaR
VVKRYSNRKLYDTAESRYVTLPQIAEMVRQGQDVRIIDNNSKDDITSMTLAQILYEEERKQSRPLPLTALKDLLASGERIITTLREGPVSKLLRRAEPPVDTAPEPDAPETPAPAAVQEAPPETPESPAGPSPTPTATRVQQFVEQSREALDQWQHSQNERMRLFWESINPAVQIQALQAEVRRLSARVEALEARHPPEPPDAPGDTPGSEGGPGDP